MRQRELEACVSEGEYRAFVDGLQSTKKRAFARFF